MNNRTYMYTCNAPYHIRERHYTNEQPRSLRQIPHRLYYEVGVHVYGTFMVITSVNSKYDHQVIWSG